MRRDDAWHRFAVPLRMARRAVQLDADVVHVFKPIGYSGLAGIWLHLFSRRPLVLDTDDWEGRGGWADVNPYPGLWKGFFGWQERWLARRADAVTVASRTLQTQVWGFGVDPGRVIYLPNGPDPRLREAGKLDDGELARIRGELGVGDAPLALYLGHIPHGNDLDLALDALALVRQRLPEARLVIAGPGDGLPALQRYARETGVAEGVVFVPGWIEPRRARRYVIAADAVVSPYRDTLINRAKCPAKVVEAMALGKAVVTSRVGQNREYIQDGRSGLLAEPGDAAELARAMLAVLSDPDRAASMGDQARQRIWDKFDWDRRSGQVEDAYRLAMGGRRG
jgi:glycosyltransferase involved in cell wall biosynthesis